MIPVDIEEERKEILKRYRKLLKQAKPVLKPGDTKLIKKAFSISLEAHKEMRRKSGEPYIDHPLEVALVCVEEIGLGTTSIIAALLHDVVEDTDLELEDIEREFGHKVMTIIDGLTKISGDSRRLRGRPPTSDEAPAAARGRCAAIWRFRPGSFAPSEMPPASIREPASSFSSWSHVFPSRPFPSQSRSSPHGNASQAGE